jgi:hypothetical protein
MGRSWGGQGWTCLGPAGELPGWCRWLAGFLRQTGLGSGRGVQSVSMLKPK